MDYAGVRGVAGHRFKQDGIVGSGISTPMSDAGLTNGAFYAHFATKQAYTDGALAFMR